MSYGRSVEPSADWASAGQAIEPQLGRPQASAGQAIEPQLGRPQASAGQVLKRPTNST
jgi:hypothetical protein